MLVAGCWCYMLRLLTYLRKCHAIFSIFSLRAKQNVQCSRFPWFAYLLKISYDRNYTWTWIIITIDAYDRKSERSFQKLLMELCGWVFCFVLFFFFSRFAFAFVLMMLKLKLNFTIWCNSQLHHKNQCTQIFALFVLSTFRILEHDICLFWLLLWSNNNCSECLGYIYGFELLLFTHSTIKCSLRTDFWLLVTCFRR